MIKIWLFLLHFLMGWFLRNQIWYDDTSSEVREIVKLKKIGLLHSGSRSKQRVKMLMFFYFHGQGHCNSSYQNMTVSTVPLELLILLLPNLVWQYIIIWTRVFYGKNGLLCSRSKSQQNFKMPVSVCPDDVFWITEPFTTKLGMVMHHYEPDCFSKRLLCCLQGQGHSLR